MPVISMFFGIVVRMYYREHGPAHFHAEYAGTEASFEFDGSVLHGQVVSPRARHLIRIWAVRYRDRLEENWRRAAAGEQLLPVPPLE